MTTRNNYAYLGIRIIFTLIAVFLMVPLMRSGEASYYQILFVFLFGRMIDLIFVKFEGTPNWLKVWNMVMCIIGIVACAFSMCAMIPDFSELVKRYVVQVNIVLMFYVVLYIIKDVITFIYLAVHKG